MKTLRRLLFATMMAVAAKGQTFTVLHNFSSQAGDPRQPLLPGVIAQGTDGNLYSTSPKGGGRDMGTVFRVMPSGELSVVYNFDGTKGQTPYGGLTLGTDGNLYGTTFAGGARNSGTIFRITTSGELAVLYNFQGGNDGFGPYAPPIEGANGDFFGTTGYGGTTGCGTVYKIAAGVFTTLHSFSQGDGCTPIGPLMLGTDGNLYGTTNLGGLRDFGEVFRLTPSGVFAISSLNGANGGYPFSGLIEGADGNFYGTTSQWGIFHWGTAFRATPNGGLTPLYTFDGNTGAGGPYAGLVQANDGNLYGATFWGMSSNGTIYLLGPAGFMMLHNFEGPDGANPSVTLVQHTSGILYGDTTNGGANDQGTFYALDMRLQPFVGLVLNQGEAGRSVGILGQGLRGATNVSFNGSLAKFVVRADTFLIATVPDTATTGYVTVQTAGGILTSNREFVVRH